MANYSLSIPVFGSHLIHFIFTAIFFTALYLLSLRLPLPLTNPTSVNVNPVKAELMKWPIPSPSFGCPIPFLFHKEVTMIEKLNLRDGHRGGWMMEAHAANYLRSPVAIWKLTHDPAEEDEKEESKSEGDETEGKAEEEAQESESKEEEEAEKSELKAKEGESSSGSLMKGRTLAELMPSFVKRYCGPDAEEDDEDDDEGGSYSGSGSGGSSNIEEPQDNE